MTLLDLATDFQTKGQSPDIMDAVDQYYADDVTIVEASGDTFHGRETQKGRIIEWQKTVEDVHSAELKSIAAHETGPGTGVAFAETAMDLTFVGMGRMAFEEVAVQQWQDGKVVHERFYYNLPGA